MVGLKHISVSHFASTSFFMMSQRSLSVNLNDFTEGKLISKDPFTFFKTWFDEASGTPSFVEPRAMCLATSTSSGIPSARFVILRGYSSNGFRFFTNYSSRKGKELNENPNAAVVFYWGHLKKSIRIEGIVEKLSEKESTEFFHSRPKNYQIEAVFSHQSQPVSNKSVLREREKEIKEQYAKCDFIPKPPEWGGFILKPKAFEFCEAQNNDFDDRIRFRIRMENDIVDNVLLHEGENGWVFERLQP